MSIREAYIEVLESRVRELNKYEIAAAALVDAVERYVEPKPGDAHVLRSELLNIKNEVKRILK